MPTPYTYLIGWRALNVWYYGVRYAKGCAPADLWTAYFTSSRHVKAFRDSHGEPDVIQVRKTLLTAEAARGWEERVLRRMGVVSSSKWLNLSYGGVKFVGCGGWNKGTTLSDERKASLRDANLGKKLSVITKQKISKSLKGLKRTDSAKANIAAAQSFKRGIPRTDEVKRKMKEAWETRRRNHPPRPHSPETIEKIRAAAISRHHN